MDASLCLKVIYLCCLLLHSIFALQLPPSPCPDVFAYEGDAESDRWYGVITFSSNVELDGMNYKVRLDRPSQLLVSSDGEVRTYDNTNYNVIDPFHTQKGGEVVKARIMVKFNPNNGTPAILQIVINGYTECPREISKTDRTKLPVQCSNLEFHCASNQSCIEYPLLCDGLKDCPDGSDETEKECAKKRCSEDEFQCTYGGCIHLSAKCDGRTDCADNSDETNADCPLITNEVFFTNHCGSNQFQCLSSKNCIDKQLLCDGKGDCVDNSDETAQQCEYNICPSFKFRCEYGACVNTSSVCDQNKDCFDGSDEFQKACSSPNSTPSTEKVTAYPDLAIPDPAFDEKEEFFIRKTCTLPDSSSNLQIKINCNGFCSNLPSRKARKDTVVKYSCKKGYRFLEKGNEFISVCRSNNWQPSFLTCKKTCEILKPENVDLTCLLNGMKVNCMGNMLEGTSVRPRCTAFHRQAQLSHYRQIHCESNGRWTDELFKCVPDCGKPIVNVKTQIARARQEKYGEAPWHVAIYNVKTPNQTLICGGTLISSYLVVSAAHCFFDERIQKLNNVKDYEVAVSKYTRQYHKRDNRFTKIYKIREIILPQTIYTGDSTGYASDIAILWVSEKILLSQAVMPACVRWTDGDQFNPGDGSLGKITRIGVTENKTSSEFRRTVHLPFISRNKCIRSLPYDFKDIVTLDKFCAGSTNDSGPGQGDSGGGLLFRDIDFGIYFLQGIVSIRGGTSPSVAVFTDINSYLDWMDQVRIRVQRIITYGN